MKRVVLVLGLVLVVGMGQTEAGVLGTLGQAGLWTWNILPQAVRVINGGLHFVCDTVHTGLHAVADWLQIENLP